MAYSSFTYLLTEILERQAPITRNVDRECLPTMYAALLFSQRRGHPIEATYAVVTSGTTWRFLGLRGTAARVDSDEYYIDDLDKILGILLYTVTTES